MYQVLCIQFCILLSRHGQIVSPNFLTNYYIGHTIEIENYEKNEIFIFILPINWWKIWKIFSSMVSIKKMSYLILSYKIVTFCKAYSSIFSYAEMQQFQHYKRLTKGSNSTPKIISVLFFICLSSFFPIHDYNIYKLLLWSNNIKNRGKKQIIF